MGVCTTNHPHCQFKREVLFFVRDKTRKTFYSPERAPCHQNDGTTFVHTFNTGKGGAVLVLIRHLSRARTKFSRRNILKLKKFQIFLAQVTRKLSLEDSWYS